jgi:hypothetical protein
MAAVVRRHARRCARCPAVRAVLRRKLSDATRDPLHADDIPDISNLACPFDNFMFDLDGVIVHGAHLIPGVAAAIAHLQAHGKRVLFLTNNSTKSRRMYADKLQNLGLQVSEPASEPIERKSERGAVATSFASLVRAFRCTARSPHLVQRTPTD